MCLVSPGGIDDATLYASVKNITRHLLQTLSVAGDNYVIVFKLLHDLSLGEVSLSPSDLSLLAKHVDLSELEEEEEEGEGKKEEKKGESELTF